MRHTILPVESSYKIEQIHVWAIGDKTDMSKRLLTLFTNPTCHLCSIARKSLTSVQSTTPIAWREVDVTQKGQETWYDKYCFDVPVIHFSPCGKSKLMHWIYEEDIKAKLKEVEGPETQWKTTQGKKRDI